MEDDRDGDEENIDTSKAQPQGCTERSPLLGDSQAQNGAASDVKTTRSASAIICLLLIGVFLSNLDSSLLLATNSTISSSFNALSLTSWLSTSYMMSSCAAQPIMGKLSNIYSRKSVLLCCYFLFALGNLLVGTGRSMAGVIAARTVQGLGAAGMSVLVSILITDLVPMRDVAPWRSYVNIVATSGRMIGGPVGGWLADTIGWRWSFLSQVPMSSVAITLVAWKLDSRIGSSAKTRDEDEGEDSTSGLKSKFARIDFFGAFLLSGGIVSFLFAVDLAGKSPSWNNKLLIGTVIASFVLMLAFLWYELYHATEPIFPPRLLLQRDVWTSYLVACFQNGAQLALMFSVPLYFQVVSNASNTEAGAHLLPAFFGNTLGSLLAGYAIKRTGRYKTLTIAAAFIGCGTYLTIMFRWHGQINIWETLDIFPGGFACGVNLASTFIALTAGMEHEQVAIATGGLYLASNIGVVLGLSVSSGLQRGALKWLLEDRLLGRDGRKIIKLVLDNVEAVHHLHGDMKELVVNSYIQSLEFSHGFSLAWAFLAAVVALCIKEHRLKD